MGLKRHVEAISQDNVQLRADVYLHEADRCNSTGSSVAPASSHISALAPPQDTQAELAQMEPLRMKLCLLLEAWSAQTADVAVAALSVQKVAADTLANEHRHQGPLMLSAPSSTLKGPYRNSATGTHRHPASAPRIAGWRH